MTRTYLGFSLAQQAYEALPNDVLRRPLTGRVYVEVEDPAWVRVVIGALGALSLVAAFGALTDSKKRARQWVWPFLGVTSGVGMVFGALKGTTVVRDTRGGP